ncbi:hypothetical protein LTR09_006097 [Extremus antarcticus]|uniref:Uncharacterized protein n=1 Tax=Extremus antarcticus TaxID=702011 RepID=A0AAJ0GBV4_9PEZI|nr:hypothetical protein LTR09_006097 [Extremus antarcticus]
MVTGALTGAKSHLPHVGSSTELRRPPIFTFISYLIHPDAGHSMAGADFIPIDDSISSDDNDYGIPVEVTAIIAEYLDSRHDLRALAVVNKIWTYGANTRLFCSIRISLAPTDRPPIGLQQWTYLLHRRESLTHVRKLEFVDERQHPATRHQAQDTQKGCKDTLRIPSNNDVDTVSLVHFVRAMPPKLGDIVWASSRQFPRGLLEELHRSRRTCRLHVETFHEPDKAFKLRHPPDVYVDAKLLANSPSLHRITVRCCEAEDPTTNHNNGISALLGMVGGRAPGLKKVCVLPAYPSPSNTVGPTPLPLPHPPCTPTPTPRGSLTSLELGEMKRRSRGYMERGFRATNSALLQELRMHDWLDSDALYYLSSLDWSSLRLLEIYLAPSKYHI